MRTWQKLIAHKTLVWDALALIACVLLALHARAERLAAAITSDEVSTMLPGGLLTQFLHQETGVNPPLWRAILAGVTRFGTRIHDGRVLAIVCSVMAVGVLFAVGRKRGGALGGLLAALPFALFQTAVVESSYARAYGLWALGASLMAWAAQAWLAAPSRVSLGLFALFALLLPQVHYAGGPLLLGLGLCLFARRVTRPLAWALVPAGVAALPLAWQIFTQTSQRAPPHDGLHAVVKLVFDWQDYARLEFLTALVLVGCAVLWRGLSEFTRFAWMAYATLAVGFLWMSQIQLVRPASVVMFAVWGGVLWSAAFAQGGWLRVLVVLWGLKAVFVWWQQPVVYAGGAGYWEDVREGATVLASTDLGEGDVWIAPYDAASIVLYNLTGRHPSELSQLASCRGQADCFAFGGRRWLTGVGINPPEPVRWVLVFGQTADPPEDCRSIWRGQDHGFFWDCATK